MEKQPGIIKKGSTIEFFTRATPDESFHFIISSVNNKKLDALTVAKAWPNVEKIIRPLGKLLSVSQSKVIDKDKLTSLLHDLFSAYLPMALQLFCRELTYKLENLVSIVFHQKGEKEFEEIERKLKETPNSFLISPDTMYVPLLLKSSSPQIYAALKKRSEVDMMLLQQELTQVCDDILGHLNLRLLIFEELKRVSRAEQGSHTIAFDEKGQLLSFCTLQPMVLSDYCFIPTGSNAFETITAARIFESRPDVAARLSELINSQAVEEDEVQVNEKVKIECRRDLLNSKKGFDVILTNLNVQARWNGKSLQRRMTSIDEDFLEHKKFLLGETDPNTQEESKDESIQKEIERSREELSTSIVAEFMRPIVKLGATGRPATMKDIFQKRKKIDPHKPPREGPPIIIEEAKPHPELFRANSIRVDKLDSWEFNVLEVPDLTTKYKVVFSLFHSFNYFDHFVIERPVMSEFIYEIQRLYNHRKNPFHNFDHGVQVAHSASMFVREQVLNGLMDEITGFSFLLACLCHDVDHTGRTNAFEIASYSSLAIRYNDTSILESHHASTTFKVLLEPRRNILKNVKEDTLKIMRKNMITNIIATDMRDHFELLARIKAKKEKYGTEFFEKLASNEDEKRTFVGFLTHACDLTGSIKPFKIAREWSVRVSQEFSAQSKEEQELELPVTPYMKDLHKPEILAKNEIGFLSFVSAPLWKLVNECLENRMERLVSCIEGNLVEWKKEQESAKTE
eukprot:TRINITY_DN5559_c0_g1_i1.p1 TRINITY_DN5559_c0_g1~~TRINITY_DN5559_c0_g1_i1.p1  ORF type:complete len:739 (+),score=98.73 TRINITY_DN5559_c0_g1_i1:186-2402(+)